MGDKPEGESTATASANKEDGEDKFDGKDKPEEENLAEELKLLMEESTQELPEDLLEGKHRGSAPAQKSPEKIVVTKPEGEETLEVVEIEEQLTEEDLPSDTESLADP